ncbi:iron complex outermembrane recepter protein [Filimonas lacunae]|uniref:Iron complex outermembrane recepter protein n=1 Tax=Filimonas lacunae TaxID=477680 RepID=A0A173MLB6_9BACT|nr:TonB-dependent receptor [Filimonas lacunae]BAV08191.1 TonB-dependent receptor YncD precursor [Filimonas lacunae]SIT10589.1 iron complex outermembrane recepter protein [Filimonas lacunae]
MILRISATAILPLIVLPAFAQSLGNSRTGDTLTRITQPDTVIVTAFNSASRWKEAPAAVFVADQQALARTGQPSLVPALNAVAGVRMEERSPGSYRLSLRGSLLRSPFGVRNLKVYWNDIPLTDAGGNTYFNLVDISQLQSLEIIKGPAASMYGANTGGVVLLHSDDNSVLPAKHSWQAGVTGGAYGLFHENAGYRYADTGVNIQVSQVHYQRDGYREQSRFRKDGVQATGTIRLNRAQQLSVMGLYTNLMYQTPGGITLQQMQTNPRLARQKTATLPSAADQQAAIYNSTVLGGISLQSAISRHVSNTTVITLNHTNFRNPFITNYEKRNEWNYGGRTAFHYFVQQGIAQWHVTAGAEWMHNTTGDDNYDNNAGTTGNVQYKDKLKATQSFAFVQGEARLANAWVLQAGISRNLLTYHYQRVTDNTPEQQREMGSLWAPRISLLYKILASVSVYGIASRGFSPPSLAEVRPSDGNYYGDLQPEHGWNYELGVKGFLWDNRIQFDVNGYYFRLQDAIVRRTNETGAEYFVNAGGTSQKGVEVFVRARLASWISVFNSFSYQPYTFTNYSVDNKNYSDNHLTGVPRTVNVSGLDISIPHGWYATVQLNQTSSIPLADDNSVFAARYQLLQAKAGYTHYCKNFNWNVFLAGDNLLNQVYSLGNDINALGGRYYNPAPGRNLSVGMAVRWR